MKCGNFQASFISFVENKFSISSIAASRWVYFVLFALIFLLTHLRQNAINNYGCEVCADKAGYYVYLPALFNYGFHASDFPDKSDASHGYGFHLDSVTNKVVTKFTCGVAIMQLPFYLMGDLTAAEGTDPFARHYLLFINIGLALYVTIGLYFLARWYATQTNSRSAFLTVLLLFFGTHLYYYVLDESLMSHAYSFVLLCTALFYSQQFWLGQRMRSFIILIGALALAVLIRPTNFLFAPIVLFIGVQNGGEVAARMKMIFTLKRTLVAIVIGLFIFLPQFFYWKFAYGKYLAWSYTGEGFTNWNQPYFMEVVFAPQSGLILYTPVLLFTFIFSFFYWRKNKNARLIITVFLLVTYLCASWSNPFFGDCNFGKRPFVEFLPVLMLPALWFVEWIHAQRGVVKVMSVSLLWLFVFYNLWLFGGFDTCLGGHTWDWNKFCELISRGSLIP